jgi:transposase InsO family protein
LSKLAVWWLRLGIQIERITPGHPQQNGRHERMHLTLKREQRSRRPRASCNSRPRSRLRRTECRRHTGRRAHLARHLHALRFGVF